MNYLESPQFQSEVFNRISSTKKEKHGNLLTQFNGAAKRITLNAVQVLRLVLKEIVLPSRVVNQDLRLSLPKSSLVLHRSASC